MKSFKEFIIESSKSSSSNPLGLGGTPQDRVAYYKQLGKVLKAPASSPRQKEEHKKLIPLAKKVGINLAVEENITEKNKKMPRDKSSGLLKKYASGLTDKEEKKQKAIFDKRKKMSDDDPEAYELTKQDKDFQKTGNMKTSKHTEKYKKMYGENLNEKIEGLSKKSKESGIPYSILKDVYDRGMAAWKSGHRPGTTPQQWAFARVNSFITGGKTRTTADKDLWSKVKKEEFDLYEEVEHDGKKVTLNKPFRTPGETKKFAVYVKNDKGNVVKVRFGDPNMEIKRDDKDRRKNYRARHNCDEPGPKWKANYWSCKFWSDKSVTDLLDD